MKIKISQSELDVMDVLWRESPLGSAEVVARLEDKKDWSARTIKTLLSRLVDKGALNTEAEGRRFLYSPAITREAYVGPAARRFAERLFGGRAAPLVAHLAEGDGLSESDIAEIEALLEKLKK
jgi:predicted transcriptional regulator